MLVLNLATTYATPETYTFGIIHPKIKAVPLGDGIKIFCFSYNKPSWNFKPHHKSFPNSYDINERPLGNFYITSDGNVNIRVSRQEHGGDYNCKGSYNNKTSFLATSYIYVGSKQKYIEIMVENKALIIITIILLYNRSLL